MTTNRFASVWDAIEDTPEEAENMKVRSQLMVQLKSYIAKSGLNQGDAAKVFGSHIHQRIDPEQIDLTAHQIGHARLSDAKDLSSVALVQSGFGNVAFQLHHQLRTNLHVLGFFWRVFNCVPDACKTISGHFPNSFFKSR